jgi:hypothetical protein
MTVTAFSKREQLAYKTAYFYDGNNISQVYSDCIFRPPVYILLFYKSKTGYILVSRYYGHPQKHTEFTRCMQLFAELPLKLLTE